MTRFIGGLAVVAAMLAGCSDGAGGPPRQAVSGVVTLDGQPLGAGSIVFVPVGPDGEPTGGEIKDGAFAIPLKNGPSPGAYSVSVYSRQATGKKLPDPNNPDATIEEGFEVIPPRYNVKTELKADVAQGGDNRFEFKLEGAIKSPLGGSREKP